VGGLSLRVTRLKTASGLCLTQGLTSPLPAHPPDSSLVINQMQGTWACEAPGLVPLHARAMSLSSGFAHVTYRHIRRELNALADALANQAMDTRSDTVVVNEEVLCQLEVGQSPEKGQAPRPSAALP
jgi:hypothetical protein